MFMSCLFLCELFLLFSHFDNEFVVLLFICKGSLYVRIPLSVVCVSNIFPVCHLFFDIFPCRNLKYYVVKYLSLFLYGFKRTLLSEWGGQGVKRNFSSFLLLVVLDLASEHSQLAGQMFRVRVTDGPCNRQNVCVPPKPRC